MDFTAFLQVPELEGTIDLAQKLIDGVLPELAAVSDRMRRQDFYVCNEGIHPGWFDETFHPRVRVPNYSPEFGTSTTLSIPEGFDFAFGINCVSLNNPLRWLFFLTDEEWQAVMLDACQSLRNYFRATNCVVTNDCGALACAFDGKRNLREMVAGLDHAEAEVATISDLYVEMEYEGCSTWDSHGFWSLPDNSESTSELVPRESQATTSCSDVAFNVASPETEISLFPVSRQGRYGSIDRKGNIAIDLQYDDAGPCVNGRALVRLGGAWQYVDAKGKVIGSANESVDKRWPVPQIEESNFIPTERCDSNGSKWGYLCAESEELRIAATFDEARRFANGFAAIRIGNFWGFIDQSGHLVVEPSYTAVGDFHEGLAAVCDTTSKWGFINAEGALVVECCFDQAYCFISGVSRVSIGRAWGCIDRAGKWLWQPGG